MLREIFSQGYVNAFVQCICSAIDTSGLIFLGDVSDRLKMAEKLIDNVITSPNPIRICMAENRNTNCQTICPSPTTFVVRIS